MLGFILACFVVGLIIVMLFTEEGRGCLGALVGLIFILLAITALGGAAIFGVLYLISSL
jgi:hypothetical protein